MDSQLFHDQKYARLTSSCRFYADSDMADRDFGRGMYRKDGYKTLNEVDEKLRS